MEESRPLRLSDIAADPFILLNLAFSTQAAYAAPLILPAQTRQADHDLARSSDGDCLIDLFVGVRPAVVTDGSVVGRIMCAA